MQLIAYKYGLLDPLNWEADCREQLFRMNRLWNSLVEIERAHRARYREIIGQDVAIAPLQTRIEALRAEQFELRTARKLRRQKAQARVPTEEINARLKSISAELAPLIEAHRSHRKAARERAREPLRVLNSERFAAAKAARQPEVSGLWWGNYNAVVGSYEVARAKAMKEGAELRFRRFTGEGRFTVQIIGGASIAEITGGTKQVALELTAQPVPERGGRPLPRLSLTIYTQDSGPRMLTFPILYDRPLPEGARIQQVVVTVRRLGTSYRYSAVFTCRVEESAGASSASQKVSGVNLGFRVVPDGLRVATMYTDGLTSFYTLPRAWLEAMDAVETIAQRRDLRLNEMLAAVRAWWPDRPPLPEEIAERFARLLKAPRCSAASLAGVSLAWRGEYESSHGRRLDAGAAPEQYDMLERLERWRKSDKHWLQRQANKRDHLIAARREMHRRAARALAAGCAVIRIGKLELQAMAQLETASGIETELHQAARANRVRASLYELQQEIRAQSPKFGARLEMVTGPFTITCHACAGRCAVGADLIHVCESCSAVWDQDENAAINISATVSERDSDAENTGQRSHVPDQTDTADAPQAAD
jgi:hypothetical protein